MRIGFRGGQRYCVNLMECGEPSIVCGNQTETVDASYSPPHNLVVAMAVLLVCGCLEQPCRVDATLGCFNCPRCDTNTSMFFGGNLTGIRYDDKDSAMGGCFDGCINALEVSYGKDWQAHKDEYDRCRDMCLEQYTGGT